MQRRTALRLTAARWAFLLVVLIGELLALTVCFDTKSLASVRTWWTGWLENISFLPEVLMAMATALLIVDSRGLKMNCERLLSESANYLLWWLFFFGHVALFVALALTTEYLFEELPRTGSLSPFVATGWLLIIAATLTMWMLAVGPFQSWKRFVRQEYRSLLAGGGVGLVAWWAGQITQRLWRPLGVETLACVEWLLRRIFPQGEVFLEMSTKSVGIRRMVATIAPDCSGYQGIGLIVVMLVAFLWANRASLRFPQALVLLPIGIVSFWLLNVLRITALISSAKVLPRNLVVGCFHSQAGWLAFNLVALGLVAAAVRIPFFYQPAASKNGSLTRGGALPG